MFCPRCGTQNESKKGYCRQCGQALSAVQLAVEGSADQSLEKLKSSEKWITQGSATVVVFTIIGLIISIIGFLLNDPDFSSIAVLNLLLGLAIGLPIIYVGRASLKRAVRLLSKSQIESNHSTLDQAQQPDKMLTSGLDAELQLPAVQGSVTEHITLDLQESQRAHRKPNETLKR